MELKCKRCQHAWNYRGRKQLTGDYPLYVTCPRCRTVVKLESKPPRDESGGPNPLPSRSQQDQTPTKQTKKDRRQEAEKAAGRYYSLDSSFMPSGQLKGGAELMTQKNTTRRAVCCPNCQAKIKSLYYLVHKSVSGEFTLAAGHEENLGADQDGIEYCCPECGEELFDHEELAEAFLLGRKARPILLEKKRAKPVAGGE
jgi:hypothetical protein